MNWMRAWLTIALALSAACSDATGPDPELKRTTRDLWSDWPTRYADTAWQTTAAPSEPTPIRLVPWAPPLTTYDTTFYAVAGQESTHAIYFQQQPWMLAPVKYMELSIPKGAEFVDPDGVPVAKGTMVPITVHADNGVVRFEFGPHGSRFSERKPATLLVSWLFADLGSLSSSGLQVWYQPDTEDPWDTLSTQIDAVGMYLSAPIYHFSNYAVAW